MSIHQDQLRPRLNPQVGRWLLALMCAVLPIFPLCALAQSQHGDFLSPSEVDELREAQDINLRVPLYLKFAKTRLTEAQKLAGLPVPEEEKKENKKVDLPTPPGMNPPKPKTLEDVISEYADIYDEMLRHLDERLDHGEDARKALQALEKECPLQQQSLKALAAKLGEDAPDDLSKASTLTSDAIDGARNTLPGLEEKFKEEKKKDEDREKRNEDF